MATLKIDELRKEIKRRNLQWEVDEAQYKRLSKIKTSRLLGYVPGPGDPSIEDKLRISKENLLKYKELRSASQLPNWFDQRHVNGQNFMTDVKFQGNCGSCVAFATVAAAEATFKRNQNDSKRKVNYSEAQLFYCWARSQGRNCDNGWWPSNALKGMRRNGVVEDSCFPYTAVNQSCNLCTDASYHLSRIVGWHNIESIREMKDWLVNRGPLIACMAVYTDFRAYKSGVYSPTYLAEYKAGHCVCVVGYDDALECWICKNSWRDFGEDEDGDGKKDGYFRIAYGACGIDSDMYAIDGVYSSQSLLELFRCKGYSFPASICTIAQTAGVQYPFLVSQLMRKIG